MNIDKARVNRFLMEITKISSDLDELIRQNDLKPGSVELKAAKYMLVEMAEAICNVLQHILAKEKGMPVSGYIDTIVKAHDAGIISAVIFNRLKPFLDFRNSLIHRYWTVDDTLLINNILEGREDFGRFVEEMEEYLAGL